MAVDKDFFKIENETFACSLLDRDVGIFDAVKKDIRDKPDRITASFRDGRADKSFSGHERASP